MLHTPFFDPLKSYEENLAEGPFGAFADGEIFQDEGEPQYEIFGHKVYLPFGIPAGPLLNSAFVKAALDKGFDMPMYKTVRTGAYPTHPWPNVLSVTLEGDLTPERATQPLLTSKEYTEPLSITNSFGVPSKDPDVWQPDMREAVRYAKRGQVVAASFQGTHHEDDTEKTYIADWVRAATLVKETGAHILEANLSCPNEGTQTLLCFDTAKVRAIAEAIKNEIGDTPLLLKTAYFENKEALRTLIEATGTVVDGFSVINTIAAEVVDKDGTQALPGGPGRKRSGVCGASIRWAGLEMTAYLKELREEFGFSYLIAGVGGVTVPDDYRLYREAGADIVMSATGAMWNPYLAREIVEVFKLWAMQGLNLRPSGCKPDALAN